MSNFEKRDNSGSLFKNETKTNEKGPDYSGSCTIDGVEFFMDSWLRTAETGRKWMSFSFKQKTKQSAAPAPAQQRRSNRDDDTPPF